MAACIHGDVCRAYMRMFKSIQPLVQSCPNGCEFYEPKHRDMVCSMYLTGYPRYECSACGSIVSTSDGKKPRICPVCGARVV